MPAHNFIDETGNKYGRLTVLSIAYPRQHRVKFVCLCDCGQMVNVFGSNLRRGNSKSCGCLAREVTRATNTKHGHAAGYKRSRTHAIWSGMLSRAGRLKWYEHVRVCDRWLDFKNFLEDMGEAPEGMTLDRYPDQRGDYEPGNCRWATTKEQQNNRTNNRVLEYKGEKKTLAQWCDELGLNYALVHARLTLGWEVPRAFTDSVQEVDTAHLKA